MATVQPSITCFQISAIENDLEKIFYIRSKWKVDPFKDLSGRNEKVICELVVTDCKIFWTRNVTLIELKNTKPDNIRNVQSFCEATQAALSGFDEYENQKLSCQITINESQVAVLTWKWSMQQTGTSTMALQFTLGSIPLDLVSHFETVKMWQEWIDFFIEERNKLQKSKNMYEIRVKDMEEIKYQMQEKIEAITAEKINNQAVLIEKFKKVMNSKKKKVKKLMKVLNANGAIMSSKLQASHDLSDEYLDENELEEEDSNESESSRVRGKASTSRPFPTEISSSSKRAKMDDMLESRSTIASESANEDQEETQQPQKRSESVLTKTYRGQVIKSRRMGRKPGRKQKDSLDNLLTVEEPEPEPKSSPEIEEVKETEATDDLLAQL